MNETQKKKILFVITKSNWGGAQKYVYDLATTLPKDLFEVSVAFGGTGEHKAEAGELEIRLKEVGIRTIFLKNFMRDVRLRSEFFALLELFKLFRKERPDIIHINSSKVGGLGAVAGRLAGVKKIVFTSHGLVYEENRPALQKAIIKFLSWVTFFFSTNTVMISKQTFEKASRLPFIKGRLHLIYNGLPHVTYIDRDFARNNFISRMNADDSIRDKTWICTISELHKNKGLEYIIPSFADERLQDCIFIVMGEGEERNNLEKIIKDNGLESKVFLPGHVQHAATYLKAFDIFTLTSIKEGHPYVLLEAGHASLPVIGTNIPGITDMIEDEKTGILIQSKNTKEITEAIFYLLSKPELTKACAESFHNKIMNDFSLERMMEQTMKVYMI